MAWHADPAILLGLLLAVLVYTRGRSGIRSGSIDRHRSWYFAGGIAALVVALVSPLDTLSDALASAHMVQHVLLLLVAGPLLVLGVPSGTLLRGTPLALRRASGRWRGRLRLTRKNVRVLRDPITVWMLNVGTIWFWHAAGPYDAALEKPFLHAIEHASFLVTAILFWRVVIGSTQAGRVANGAGILLVFAMALQSVFLSTLLTFATTPWYSGYAHTTRSWGLQPLADQQLAGVIMWVPAGLVYVGAGLALLVAWIRGTEQQDVAPDPYAGSAGSGTASDPAGSDPIDETTVVTGTAG